MEWVKLHVGLFDNDRFHELSPNARLTFLTAIGLVGKLQTTGALIIQGWGPMGARHVARYTGLSVDDQEAALRELLDMSADADGARFLSIEGDAYSVKRWSEKAGEESRRAGDRDRASRSRHGKRDAAVTAPSRKKSRKRHADGHGPVTAASQKSHATRIAREEELDTTSPSGSLHSPPVDGSGAQKPEPQPTWPEEIREATRALARRSISTLNPDERMILGRYHALEFANCTKSEAYNKNHATKIAGAFASMGRSKDYGAITVAEYVAFARKTHANREETPWYNPWDIRAVVEFEGAS